MPSTSPLSSWATGSGSTTAVGREPRRPSPRGPPPRSPARSAAARRARARGRPPRRSAPSKISSSLPPTWFTKTQGTRVARREVGDHAPALRRLAHVPWRRGEVQHGARAGRDQLVRSGRWRYPISCTQASSQTVRPNAAPPVRSVTVSRREAGCEAALLVEDVVGRAAASWRAPRGARRRPAAPRRSPAAAGPRPPPGSTAPSAIATRARGRRERVELAQLIAHEALALEQVHRRIAGEDHLRQDHQVRALAAPPWRRPPRRAAGCRGGRRRWGSPGPARRACRAASGRPGAPSSQARGAARAPRERVTQAG